MASALFEFIPLLDARIPPHRANINHAVTELHKSTALLRQAEVCNVLEAEIDQVLVLLLAEPVDEAVAGERLSETVGRQAVFGKAEVEEGGDRRRGGAELLLLLPEIGAADLDSVRREGLSICRGGD